MKVNFSTCLLALTFIGLAQSSYAPTAPVGDAAEYLRVLTALKSGTMKMPNLNITGTPWNYTSQGLEFKRKLKQSEFLDFILQVPNMLVKQNHCLD
jgi:hypothetical protein